MRALLLVLAAAALALALLAQPARATGSHDPCADQGDVGKGDSYTIGIAYWAGSTVDSWDGLNPCTYEGRQRMIANGVQTAIYRPKVDTLTVMRTTKAAEERAFASQRCTTACNNNLMTVVAYAGNATRVRSEARVVWSRDAVATGGTGRVVSLALIARFSRGELKYLQWHDLGCSTCESAQCIDGISCADAEADCSCNQASGQCKFDLAGADFNRCRAAVHVAFAGTDKHSDPMVSGTQILKLSDFSVSGKGKETAEAAIAKGQELSNSASSTFDSVSENIDAVTG